MLDEQQFKTRADQSLEDLYDSLNRASEEHDGFEADFNNGALSIEFEEPPAKFVVSPNAPVRQIWVSAHTRSFKLDWNEQQGAFVLAETGQSLNDLIGWAVGTQIGEEVVL